MEHGRKPEHHVQWPGDEARRHLGRVALIGGVGCMAMEDACVQGG